MIFKLLTDFSCMKLKLFNLIFTVLYLLVKFTCVTSDQAGARRQLGYLAIVITLSNGIIKIKKVILPFYVLYVSY